MLTGLLWNKIKKFLLFVSYDQNNFKLSTVSIFWICSNTNCSSVELLLHNALSAIKPMSHSTLTNNIQRFFFNGDIFKITNKNVANEVI